jgi:hypothetical protein
MSSSAGEHSRPAKCSRNDIGGGARATPISGLVTGAKLEDSWPGDDAAADGGFIQFQAESLCKDSADDKQPEDSVLWRALPSKMWGVILDHANAISVIRFPVGLQGLGERCQGE